MTLSDLAARGANIAVVLFVVSSTLGVGLSLTPAQILAPLKDIRVVSLALVANFVAAPLVAFGLWRLLALDEPLGIGLLLCGLAAGAPFLIKLAEFAKAYDGPPTDPKVFEETQKKLQEELQKRAAEARQKLENAAPPANPAAK